MIFHLALAVYGDNLAVGVEVVSPRGAARVNLAGRFVIAVQRFLAETEPARFDREEWQARFRPAEPAA